MERDGQTGLDHTQYREYSPMLARWLSPDPICANCYDPQNLNRYSYVRNDPMNRIDPDGRQEWSPVSELLWLRQMGWEYSDAISFLSSIPGVTFNEAQFWYLRQNNPGDSIQVVWDAAAASIGYVNPGGTNPGSGGEGGVGPSGRSTDGNSGCVNGDKTLALTNQSSLGHCLAQCTMDQLGITSALGVAGAISGMNILGASGKLEGATKGTSIASKYLSQAFPQTLPFRVPTPTAKLLRGGKMAYTKVLGRALGRFVPVIGWGLLAYDAVSVGICTNKCMHEGF
jgi:RHS repeat-associated protein